MSKLAIRGGEKTRKKPFPPHPTIGDEEKKQVMEVLESGNISSFVATQGPHFLGGKKIQEFEESFSSKFGAKYGVTFNSASSALHGAVVACGIKPGDEVIVPPNTFTSTASSALMQNAIPVFCDVQKDIFSLDPKKIEKNITSRTKAITNVHLLGHPSEMDDLLKIAKKNNLKIIEDCAQSPGAIYKDQYVGLIGDCGVFSFQESKNIMTGEGGMLLTNDDDIAKIARMVRNHGEVITSDQHKRTYQSEILGWGYRMTELDAALGVAQVPKLDFLNNERITLGSYLASKINKIDGLKHVKYDHVKHVYWLFGFTFDEDVIGISRDLFYNALVAEGIPCVAGYASPLYLQPLYQNRAAYAFKHYEGEVTYEKGICPVAESLFEKKLLVTDVCRYPATIEDIDDVVNAIHKIIENKKELISK